MTGTGASITSSRESGKTAMNTCHHLKGKSKERRVNRAVDNSYCDFETRIIGLSSSKARNTS